MIPSTVASLYTDPIRCKHHGSNLPLILSTLLVGVAVMDRAYYVVGMG